jgi:hypothetical protein
MSPKRVPDTKMDRPTAHRSQHQLNLHDYSEKFVLTDQLHLHIETASQGQQGS